jgi:hypothetical protein
MTEIEKILKDVEFTTQNIANEPFTKRGFSKFKEKVGVYLSSLYIESQKTAKRHKADNISESHVETASGYLIKNNDSKVSKLMGVLGGVFLGAAVSNLLAITVLGQTFSNSGIVITIILGILGSFMIGINMMKE